MLTQIFSSCLPTAKHYHIFRNFFENCEEGVIGVSWLTRGREPITPYELSCRDQSNEYVRDWKSRFEALSSGKMLESYFNPEEWFLTCNGGVVALPSKYLMTSHRKICEFVVRASRDLLDLEAGLSLYASLGNKLFDIYLSANLKTLNLRDRMIGEVKMLIDYCSDGSPFLLHYFSSKLISSFYQGIGIFDD